MDERFQIGLDSLCRTHRGVLNAAIDKSKHLIMSMFKTVQGALDMKKVISAGPFMYFIIQEVNI